MVYHDLVRFFIVGFVSGWVAAIAVRGRIMPRGCAPYIFLGLIGAFAARVLAASLGSVVSLLVGRLLRGNL